MAPPRITVGLWRTLPTDGAPLSSYLLEVSAWDAPTQAEVGRILCKPKSGTIDRPLQSVAPCVSVCVALDKLTNVSEDQQDAISHISSTRWA